MQSWIHKQLQRCMAELFHLVQWATDLNKTGVTVVLNKSVAPFVVISWLVNTEGFYWMMNK